MINTQAIERYIKALIDKSVTKFILYPYGVNGKTIHEVLKNKFSIEPVHIVDNALCEWDTDIVSLAELKKEYDENSYVILTVENRELNTKMYAQLKTFIEQDKIINILDCEKYIQKSAFPDFSSFRIQSLLGNKNDIVKERNSAIKIRILNFSRSTWNAIRTVCQACEDDAQIDLLL